VCVCVCETLKQICEIRQTNEKKSLSIYLLEEFNFGQVMFQIKKIIIGNLHLLIEALHNKPKPRVENVTLIK